MNSAVLPTIDIIYSCYLNSCDRVCRSHSKCTHSLWLALDEHSPLEPTCQQKNRIPAVYSFPPGKTQYTRDQSIYLGCKTQGAFYQKLHVDILATQQIKSKYFRIGKKKLSSFPALISSTNKLNFKKTLKVFIIVEQIFKKSIRWDLEYLSWEIPHLRT